MASILVSVVGTITATYMFLYLLLHISQDTKEPPAIVTQIPFLNKYGLPIYTLRLPFSRIYIANDTELLPSIQAQWRAISFSVFTANTGEQLGMTKTSRETMERGLMDPDSFSISWPKYMQPAMVPGEDLDRMNKISIEAIASATKDLSANGTARVGLWQWTHDIIIRSTSKAVWGPQNPFEDEKVEEAWKIFEPGFLTLNIFPFASLLFPQILRARERIATAMVQYMRRDGPKSGSGLVRRLVEHHTRFGLPLEDIARSQIGIGFAVMSNTAPCALWMLYHIFSDERVLEDVRREVAKLVETRTEEGGGVETATNVVDLSALQSSCPVLLSTFQETLRVRTLSPGVRMLLEDAVVDDTYLLKKGNLLMMPAMVHHTSAPIWGPDANLFNHLRFKDNPRLGRTAFRGFGGGHVLCPGRFFARTEIMALAALLLLRFDVMPAGGNGSSLRRRIPRRSRASLFQITISRWSFDLEDQRI
ncbi:uncharacterized protein PG986_000155 [Apiospora aurea]|uniref:Cytochrome P450 n=1 Tax=Apiospora aurea TaxID=335848 RepID=A0ABR1QT69_9PEZI